MMMARHGQNFLMLPCSIVNAVSGPLGLNDQADQTKPASTASGLTIWVKPLVSQAL
jgi:hypothetical protein